MSMMVLEGAGFDPTGTFRHLGTLERVPLPDLSDTCRRFEQWCAPLLNERELAQTTAAVARFAQPGGAGETLHRALAAYAAQEGVFSWLDDFWAGRYLGRRVPIAINANFAFLLKDRNLSQVQCAAELVCTAVDVHLRLQQERVPAAERRGTPLCMAEYKYLFSSTRIPGTVHDSVRAPYSAAAPGASQARHVLVLHNGHIWRLDVLDDEGRAYTLSDIEAALEHIRRATAAVVEDVQAVGYLTALPRAAWAGVREDLISVAANAASMETVEQALFCVCLDRANGLDRKLATDEVLCGDGGNRWFDKSISFIVLADGAAGVNGEHCGLDGTVVVEFIDHMRDPALLARLRREDRRGREAPACRPVRFQLADDVQAQVLRAKREFDALKANTATHYVVFEDFGTERIKALSMSPDAFLQLAFQWAHYKTKGLTGTTYESVATRHFERGRTEAMRVVTPASQDFVAAMQDRGADAGARVAAFRAAAEAHTGRARECQAGFAPEQHLWQLQMMAQDRAEVLGIDAADIALFESPGWLRLRDDYLSTSSVPSDNITMFGFGATSEQCIGIAYLPRAEAIYLYLSTPTPVAADMRKFGDNFAVALRELEALLSGDGEERRC